MIYQVFLMLLIILLIPKINMIILSKGKLRKNQKKVKRELYHIKIVEFQKKELLMMVILLNQGKVHIVEVNKKLNIK